LFLPHRIASSHSQQLGIIGADQLGCLGDQLTSELRYAGWALNRLGPLRFHQSQGQRSSQASSSRHSL
jgi:hypothetical protein